MKKTLSLLILLCLFTCSILSQTVYVTKTGEKYHRKECQYLRNSSRSIDLKDAVAVGYEPCKVCKPQTGNSRSSTFQQNNNTKKSSAVARSVQCSGITKKGTRCKRMTTNSSGRCYQH